VPESKCLACGNEVPADASKCPHCRTRLERCPHCAELVQRTDKVCPHCQRQLGGKAMLSASATVPATGRASGVGKVFYVISMLAALVGSVVGIGGVAAAQGAPQEAAAAAIGCLIVIAPYVFARGVDEITR
jgi:RNA polymerase subunit RPABC4/transcription elongation factor Spt4